MTEEARTEEVVEEAVVEFAGIAGTINEMVGALKEARDKAVELESGLTSKAAIQKASVALRAVMVDVQKGIKSELRNVIATRKDLVENVAEIQASAKKAALEAKVAKLQAELEAMDD